MALNTSPHALRRDIDQLLDFKEEMERRDRSLEGLEGRIASTDSALDAVSNQSWTFSQFAAEQRKVNGLFAAELTATRKAAERAIMVPLAIVAFFLAKEVSLPTGWTVGVTLFVAIITLFFPELAARWARKVPLGEAILPEPVKEPPKSIHPPLRPTDRNRDTKTNE